MLGGIFYMQPASSTTTKPKNDFPPHALTSSGSIRGSYTPPPKDSPSFMTPSFENFVTRTVIQIETPRAQPDTTASHLASIVSRLASLASDFFRLILKI